MATKDEILALSLTLALRDDIAAFRREMADGSERQRARRASAPDRVEAIKTLPDVVALRLDALEARLESLHSHVTMEFQQILDELRIWRSVIISEK